MRGVVAILFALVLATPAAADEIAVIVNPAQGGSLSRAELIQVYLKQRRFWADGAAILAVNHEAGSELRARFEQALLGARARRLGIHWNRAYYRGVLPPPTLASDAAMLRFVGREPRAIGYVNAASLDGTVRVLLRLPAPESAQQTDGETDSSSGP